MGYIFDAMNRDDRDDRDEPQNSPDTPPEQTTTDASEPTFSVASAMDRIDSEHADAEVTAEVDDTDDPDDQEVEAVLVTEAAAGDVADAASIPIAHPKKQREARAEPPPAAPETPDVPRSKEGYPVIDLSSGRIDDRLLMLTEPASVMAEEYRAIRTGLLARHNHERQLLHTITSATPQEGKTITSLNLGLSFAELRNRKTLVVEADLRLPQFQRLLNLPDGPGLIGVLNGECQLKDAICVLGETNLHLIAAGGRASNDAVQLIHSGRMTEVLRELRREYDHVIFDTPPVVELAEAGILGAASDDVLLITRMKRTPRTLVEQAIRTLGSYKANVAGIIATDQQRKRRGYYYRYGYGYHYRYHYSYTDRQAA